MDIPTQTPPDIPGLLRRFFDVPDTPGRILRGDYQKLIPQPSFLSSGCQYSIHAIPVEFQIYLIDSRDGFSTHVCIDRETQYYIRVPHGALPAGLLHRHSHLELVCILEGSVNFVIEGGHRRYGKGALCLMNTNVRHSEAYQEDFTALYLNFHPAYLKKALEESGGATKRLLRFLSHSENSTQWRDHMDFHPAGGHPYVEEALYRLVWENLFRQPGYAAMTQQLLGRLGSYLQSGLYRTACYTGQPLTQGACAAERTIRFLLDNPRRLSREEISRHTGYNSSYLNRVFLAQTGQTLAEYNRRVYLDRAAQLLLNTRLPVSRIAGELGFESRSAFYEQFQKHFGVTPSAYRSALSADSQSAPPSPAR